MTIRTIRAGDLVFTVNAAMHRDGGYATRISTTDLAASSGGTETIHQESELRHASEDDALRHGELHVKAIIKRTAD